MFLSRTITATLCGAALLWLASPLRADDERLRRIIDNVRANEALYQNIEGHVTLSYKLLDPDVGEFSGAVKSSTGTARTVLQDHLLYFRRDETNELTDNTSAPINLEMGYDGEYTRRVQGKVANLVHGRDHHARLFRPHTWLLHGARVSCPLSIWLAGGKELQNHPEAGHYKDYWTHKVFYEKEEVVDGLHTVKLRSDGRPMHGPDTLITIRYLWLATDRNYLPVKTEASNPRWSTPAMPGEVGRATDFREIAPGVWLPFHRSTVTYTDYKLAENKQVVANTQEATLTKVDLNPSYDISLFRDIPIPDGTLVYEVKDGKIFNKYTQGEETSPHWPSRRSWPWRWLVGPCIGLVLVGGWVAYRWRARTRGRAPAA